MNIFEKATRIKLRIPSGKGDLTVEQLWDLPLTSSKGVSLDGIGVTIRSELSAASEGSLVTTAPNPRKAELELMFGLIQHVINVRQEQNAEARNAKERADEKTRLMGILAEKQEKNLRDLSEDEIIARLAKLG